MVESFRLAGQDLVGGSAEGVVVEAGMEILGGMGWGAGRGVTLWWQG